MNNICLKNNIQLKPTIELDRHSLIIEFVKAGLGIGFATKQYVQSYFDNNELVELNVNFNIEKRYIKCVQRNNNDIKVKKFIDLLKKNLKSNS